MDCWRFWSPRMVLSSLVAGTCSGQKPDDLYWMDHQVDDRDVKIKQDISGNKFQRTSFNGHERWHRIESYWSDSGRHMEYEYTEDLYWMDKDGVFWKQAPGEFKSFLQIKAERPDVRRVHDDYLEAMAGWLRRMSKPDFQAFQATAGKADLAGTERFTAGY